MDLIYNFFTLLLYGGLAFIEAFLIKRMCYSKHKRTRRISLLFACLLPVLLATFRGETGTDSSMYRRAYEYGDVFRWVDFEIGFRTLMNVLHSMRMPYQMVFFIMAFGTTLPILLAINKKKDVINVYLAGIIWITDFYMFSMNAMRQALAISLCIYAFILYLDNKKIWALLLIALACTFHTSALMCFALIFCKILFDNRHSKALITVAIIAVVFLVMNRSLLGSLISMVTGKSYYGAYVTRDAYTDGSVISYFIKISPILIISTLNFRNYHKDRDFIVYYALMIMGYIFSSLGYVTATQVGRIGEYFSNLSILVLAFDGKYKTPIGKKRYIKAKNIRMVLYAYLVVVFLYDYFYKGFSKLVPYQGLFG